MNKHSFFFFVPIPLFDHQHVRRSCIKYWNIFVRAMLSIKKIRKMLVIDLDY